MKVAVLSGKGGAGKTMVAVNLAATASQATYIDCDVEEPNGRLFFKPEQVEEYPVSTLLPEFDGALCDGCRECVQHCRFHALIYIREKPQVFPEVCHSCGLCSLVCPNHAVREVPKEVGRIQVGRSGHTRVVTGELNPGEASGIPVLQAALNQGRGLTVIDCPPGSACAVMESIQDADYCILVAEPTAFGFHNFKMVRELTQLMEKPTGVVINKMETPYEPLEAFCRQEQLPVLARIPYQADMARSLSRGEVVSREDSQAEDLFSGVWEQIGVRI